MSETRKWKSALLTLGAVSFAPASLPSADAAVGPGVVQPVAVVVEVAPPPPVEVVPPIPPGGRRA
jgi:hypothetical protein